MGSWLQREWQKAKESFLRDWEKSQAKAARDFADAERLPWYDIGETIMALCTLIGIAAGVWIGIADDWEMATIFAACAFLGFIGYVCSFVVLPLFIVVVNLLPASLFAALARKLGYAR